MTARDKRVEKAQIRVLLKVPFFAAGVAKLPVVFSDTVDTACTDGQRIVFGTKFFDSLKDEQIPTVLCHEVAHCMLGHLWRAPAGCDWDQWNQATDHAVNLMLKEFSAQEMAKRLADPFPFPEPADAYCADPQYTGMAEEAIYAKLPKKPKGKGGKGSGQGKPQPGSMPSFGQMEQPKPDPGAQAAAKKLASNWDGTFVQACEIAKARGEMPASMDRLIDKLVNPQVPWQELLRSWLREQCSDDWNFLEPAMEYSGGDFILPSLKSEKMGSVVFATDTSGSITGELLTAYQSEKQGCLDSMRPRKLVDIYCDSSINLEREYSPGDLVETKLVGGGGTDFRPVFDRLDSIDPPPKCLVYLTDLCGTFPDNPPAIPVIWVCWEKGMEAPFGQVVYVNKQH